MKSLMGKLDFLVGKYFNLFDLLTVFCTGALLAHSGYLTAVLAAVLLVSWLSRVLE